jgi:hypothetical protein
MINYDLLSPRKRAVALNSCSRWRSIQSIQGDAEKARKILLCGDRFPMSTSLRPEAEKKKPKKKKKKKKKP